MTWTKVWAFRDPEKYRFLEKDPHTRVVAWRTADYYRACACAGYWITNSRMPRELSCRKDQAYIQCWHGTPLKKLGYDLEQYAEKNSTLSEVRENYLAEARRVTHMPSPSPFLYGENDFRFHLRRWARNVFGSRDIREMTGCFRLGPGSANASGKNWGFRREKR